MFIENPNKKESYSFRVKPDLLENIKNYAKATNQTVPEILNDMIEEKTKGLHLTNDYLRNFNKPNTYIICLPSLTEIYNNGNYKEFDLAFENENSILYEVHQIPNNIDIWTEEDGYTSGGQGVDHEGISFVLAPELITRPMYLEDKDLLMCCLVPIYFRIIKRSIRITNISFKKLLNVMRYSHNMELLDEYKKVTSRVKKLIFTYHDTYKNATENPDGTYYAKGNTYNDKNELLFNLYGNLILELNKYSNIVNTNVTSYHDKAMETVIPLEEFLNSDVSTYTQFGTMDLLNRVSYLKKENEDLKTENQEIKNKMESIETELNKIKRVFYEIDKKGHSKEEILNHLSED